MFFRYDGIVQSSLGEAIAGANIAVLSDPSDFSTQPGSPLVSIYAASASNSANVTAAFWQSQQIQFTLNAVPADVVPNSFIGISGVTPSTFNSTLEAPYLVVSVVGLVVTVAALTNPGIYVSGGVVATSLLPNPTLSDGNGNFFFYAASGLYGVQIYYSTVELDFPDQGVGFLGGGSVTSIALTVPAQLIVTGSPITTSGTLAITWATESANLVLAGPASGPAAAPTFRALTSADLPGGFGTVSSVGLTIAPPAIFTSSVTGSPVTGSGTLAISLGLATQSANFVWAGPTSGSAAPPTFRGLTLLDIGTRTNRVLYTTTATDVTNGYKNITVTFATPFADMNYTVEVGLALGAVPAWPGAAQVVATNTIILDPNGMLQVATTGGTTGGTIPTFATVDGATTSDNSVVWTLSIVANFVTAIKAKTISNFVVEVAVTQAFPLVLECIAIHD